MPSTKGLVPADALSIGRGSYGPHCTYEASSTRTTLAHGGAIIAAVAGTTVKVDLSAMTPLLVTPVNVFIGERGKVEKYWRTGGYVLKVRGGARVVAGATTPATSKPTAKGASAPVAVPASIASPKPADAVVEPVAEAPFADEPEPVVVEPVVVKPAITAPSTVVVTGEVEGLEYPEHREIKALAKGYSRVGRIIVKDKHVETLKRSLALVNAGHPAHVLMTGPAGTAKTLLVEEFAGAMHLPLVRISGGKIRTADDWFGSAAKDLTWKPSPFTQVMERGVRCIVLVDEINRAESVTALNGLLNVLDESGITYIPDALRSVKMPSGILVIATANIGPEFVGTLKMDAALRDRMPWGVTMDFPPEAVEAKLVHDLTGLPLADANKLAVIGNAQRTIRMDVTKMPSRSVISTRFLIDVARGVMVTGDDIYTVLLAAFEGRFAPGDQKHLITLADTQFAAPVVENDGDITEVDLAGL